MRRFNVTMPVLMTLVTTAPTVRAADAPVTLAEDAAAYTLANGVVTAKVSKRSGDLVSLKYKDLELLAGGSGHAYAYWSHSAASPKTVRQFGPRGPKSSAGVNAMSTSSQSGSR